MASLGHVAIGLAAARVAQHRPRWPALACWSALSMLPDADVIGFSLGVDYGDPWGHRGATHSLATAVVVGLTIGLAAGSFKRPIGRTAAVAIVVLASHALLDTMTDGGLGCALLWPFDLTVLAPWRPIPVAPIGWSFLSPSGGIVVLTELILFAPAIVFALRPARRRVSPAAGGFLLALWLVAVWLIVSTDRFHDAIVGDARREDTHMPRLRASGVPDCRLTAGCRLADIVHLASEAIRDLDIAAEVIGATRGGHDTSYAEVIVAVRDGEREPTRLRIGVDRCQSRDEGRHTIASALRNGVHGDDVAEAAP